MQRGRGTPETQEHRPPGEADARPSCASVFVEGRSFVVELPVHGSVVLGRDTDCDLQLCTGSVSRRHARIDMRGDHGAIVDLGSRNGTFVNAERLDAAPRNVGRGDEIWIGSARMGLIGGAVVPASARAVLVRSGLFARIDADLARGVTLHALATRLAERWYAHDDVLAWLPTLPVDAYVGAASEDVLIVVSRGPLTGSTPPGAVGRVTSEGIGTGTALVTAAVQASISAVAPRSGVHDAPLLVSPAMSRVGDEASRIAPSAVNVLLVGETGVGKELFARMIHEKSGRTGPLVSVNTAAIPEALVESELFGHERGAFSGAHAAKVGLVEAAQKGTLFLDEIGDLPLALQAKLLRVLEERTIRPVGATQERRVDVRVVAATHANLERAVEAGTFRRDLFYRLNACTLRIPPLRERKDELEPLARQFLAEAAREGAPPANLAPTTVALLHAYDWPGNVRELRNVIERGAALAEGSAVLLPEHLPDHVRRAGGHGQTGAPPAPDADVRDALKDYERQRILDALDLAGGNRTEAAKLLGLPRRTLTYKLSKLGIVRS
jgi:two-component system, NtrC family, response regulator AtoC